MVSGAKNNWNMGTPSGILLPVFVILVIAAIPLLSTAQEITQFPVPPPPFSEGIFPCSDCHADMEPNTTPRKLDMHEDIELKHFKGWCFDCHNPKDRDKLRLASGKLISFEQSEYLCGQCHGTIFRDWKVGVHGKRTGMWNGKKLYRLCVNCHWPHAPRFKPLTPLPPPVRPDDIQYRKLTEDEIPLNPINPIIESEQKNVKE